MKTEFEKYEKTLKKMQGHLNQTSEDLNTLIETRTSAMNKKLRGIQTAKPQTQKESEAID